MYTSVSIRMYSSGGRAEDCHPAALGSINPSAMSKLQALNITHIDGYVVIMDHSKAEQVRYSNTYRGKHA